jgi:phospholipid/cholesterol/gamma-HCH transport system substrate-binding protein
MRRVLVIALAALAVALIVVIPSATGADDGPYKVRGIFDNGSFIVEGEEVRVAGATVGTIESVDVTGEDEIASLEGGPHPVPGKAVVVMNITDDAFKDFREDASCIIRPQSLIGERLVDCTPTQPRAAGTEPPPELEEIEDGPGEGQRLLPLENNGKSVDIDLIQNINRMPYRDRFRLILNDLGAGLAARGDDLGAVVDRANPALRQTNRVLKILADQEQQLSDLASNGDAVLEQLAANRTSVTGFFRGAGIAGQATAERGDDLEAQIEKFPETLRQVRATMRDLKGFADQGTPLMQDVGASAKDLSKATQNLPAFFKAGLPALTTLGDAAESAGPKLVAADPVVVQTRDLTDSAGPAATDLAKLLRTFEETDGFQYLLDFIRNSSGNINTYDQYGHFQRALGLRSNCLDILVVQQLECAAFFFQGASGAATAKDKKRQLKPSGSGVEPVPADPSLEEVVPELDPDEPEETEPEEPTETIPEDEDPADPQEGDEETADEAVSASDEDSPQERRARRVAERQGLSMREATLLLEFLLGGSGA